MKSIRQSDRFSKGRVHELVYFQLYIMATTGYIRSDDVRFVLNQHAELRFYHSVSSLKQQSTGLDKSLHPYVLSWLQAKQSLFLLYSVW